MIKLGDSGVTLSVGATMHVERRFELHQVRGTCRVLGHSEPNFLMASLPYVSGQPMFGLQGGSCVVRTLVQGRMYGFRAQVPKVLFDPVPMMLLEYPEAIEEVALRKHDRLLCSLSSTITLPQAENDASASGGETPRRSRRNRSSGEVALRSLIIDLAEGGCQLVTAMISDDEPLNSGSKRFGIPPGERANYREQRLTSMLSKGNELRIAFDLPEPQAASYNDVPFEVRWSRPVDRHLFSGIRFLENPKGLNERVTALMDYLNTYFSRDFSPL